MQGVRQVERELGEGDQGPDHAQHRKDVGDDAEHDLAHVSAAPGALDDIEIEADGRGDQRHLDQHDHQDAEPYRIEAELHDERHHDRDRHHHEREGLDEEPEHDVHGDEDEDRHQRAEAHAFEKAAQFLAETGRRQREIEERGPDHDEHDHRRDLHRAGDAFQDHARRQPAEQRGDDQRAADPHRCGLRRRRPALVDRADDHREQDDDRDQVEERDQPFAEGEVPPLACQRRPDAADGGGDRDERQRQQDPRQQAGDEQPRNRRLGQEAVDDQVDRRRYHDAERAAGRDRARKQLRIVAEDLRLRHGDGGDRRRRRDGRTRRRGEHRRRGDVGVDEPARKPGQPAIERPVGPRRDPAAHQHLAEKHEEGNRDQRRAVRGRPHDVAEAPHQRKGTEEPVDAEAQQEQDDADRNGKAQQSQEADRYVGDHTAASCSAKAPMTLSDSWNRPCTMRTDEKKKVSQAMTANQAQPTNQGI